MTGRWAGRCPIAGDLAAHHAAPIVTRPAYTAAPAMPRSARKSALPHGPYFPGPSMGRAYRAIGRATGGGGNGSAPDTLIMAEGFGSVLLGWSAAKAASCAFCRACNCAGVS